MRQILSYHSFFIALSLILAHSTLIIASQGPVLLAKKAPKQKALAVAAVAQQVKAKPAIKTNIPSSYFRVTEQGIYINGPLECLKEEFFLEAEEDVYIHKLMTKGNIIISTTGALHLQDDVFAEGSVRIKGKEIVVHTFCKAHGRMQLLADKTVRIIGSVKTKDILELIGKENVSIEGTAKGNEGVLAVAGGKLDQKGAVTSHKDVMLKAKEYTQTGMVVSQLKTVIFSEEDLTLTKVGQIAALQLSLKSTLKNVLIEGEAYSKEGTLLSAGERITIAGTATSEGPVAIEAKNYSLTKSGSLTSAGLSLQLEIGVSFGSTLTRGHYSLKAKKYTAQKDSSTFTAGVHQVDCSDEYMDQGLLYVPVLFLAQGARLKFYEGHHSYIKEALLSSSIQIHIAEGTNFDLFGPRIFFQLASDGGVTFRGKAIHDSVAQFPLNLYLASKYSTAAQASSITEAQLKAEIEQLAQNHPWRSLKKGTGFTITVQGSVKYAGTTKLDSGAFAIDAQGDLDAQRGKAQAGFFDGDSVSLRSANMALDKSSFQSYFDDVKMSASEGLTMKQVDVSAGMNTLIKALSAAIEKSSITSIQGRTDVDVKKSASVAMTTFKSSKETLLRGKEVVFTGVDIASNTTAVVLAEQALRIYDSSITSVQNTLAGKDVDMRKVALRGNTTVHAENDLGMSDLKSTGKVATQSGGTTTLHNVEGKEVVSHGKKIVKDGKLISEGAVELVADTMEHAGTTEGQTIFIQTTEFNDSASSTVVGHQRVSLDVKKGNGLQGRVIGDTVSISMDDFQLANLKQVIARVTQLHINKDVVIDKDTVLKNSLHLWARKLINRAGLTVEGDFSAYMTSDILLNGTMNIKGTGAFSGATITSEQGKLSGANLYLQAREGDVSLYKAILKAVTDVKIDAERANIKKTASTVVAGRDAEFTAAGSLVETSIVERTESQRGTDEKIVRDSTTTGRDLTKKAGQNIIKTAVEANVGGNYYEKAVAGSVVDLALARETIRRNADEENSRSTREVTPEVSEYKVGGIFTSEAGENQDLTAPKIDAQAVRIAAEKKVIAREAHRLRETQNTHNHDGGFFGQQRNKRSYTFEALSIGLNINAAQGVEIKGGDEVSLTNVSIKAPSISITSTESAVRILLGTNQTYSQSSGTSSNILWQSQQSEVQKHTTYAESKLDGVIEIKAKQLFVQEVKGKTLELAKKLESQGIKAIYEALDEVHVVDAKSSEGPSAALAAVVVIAVSICTAGTGAALGTAAAGAIVGSGTGLAATAATAVISAAIAAGFTSLCCQASLALLANKGDIIKAAESLASTRTLENMGVAMLTAGVTAGISSALHIPSASQAKTTIERIEGQVVQSSVSTTAAIAQGKKPEDAAIQGLKGAAAGAIGAIATTEIGHAYYHHDIDFIGHKFLHALVGGATGALMGDKPLEGAAAGAFGAVTAELIGELVLSSCHKIAGDVVNKLDSTNTPITDESKKAAIRDELTTRTNIIKVLTSGVALLTGQDVSLATFTATNALDYNLAAMAQEIIKQDVDTILQLQSGTPANQKDDPVARFLIEFGINTAEGVRGIAKGVNHSFESTAELLKAIADNPTLAYKMPANLIKFIINEIPPYIMNVVTDPSVTKETLKNIRHYFEITSHKIANASSAEIGEALGGFLGDLSQALATGGASAATKESLASIASFAKKYNSRAITEALYEQIRHLPVVAREDMRAQASIRLIERNHKNPARLIYPGEPAEAYVDLIEKSLTNFQDAQGLLGKNSPITKMFDALERNVEKEAGVSGYEFELKAAQNLKEAGYKIEAFGEELGSNKHPKLQEFDITIKKDEQITYVQCKLRLPPNPDNSHFGKIGLQKKTAADLGATFELISTSEPSEAWKAFFKEKNIKFRKITLH